MQTANEITAIDIMEAALNEVKRPGDHFMIDPNESIWYSRYFAGGSFQAVCGFVLQGKILQCNFRILDDKFTFMDKTYKIDITAPDSFRRIGERILKYVDTMQKDRGIRADKQESSVYRKVAYD
jgi:hypothetical protein